MIPTTVDPPTLPTWSWSLPVIDASVEGVVTVPHLAQGAPIITPQYDTISRDFADKGLLFAHSVLQWVHGREWRVSSSFQTSTLSQLF